MLYVRIHVLTPCRTVHVPLTRRQSYNHTCYRVIWSSSIKRRRDEKWSMTRGINYYRYDNWMTILPIQSVRSSFRSNLIRGNYIQTRQDLKSSSPKRSLLISVYIPDKINKELLVSSLLGSVPDKRCPNRGGGKRGGKEREEGLVNVILYLRR